MYYTDIKKLTYNHTLSLSVYLVFMYEIELCRSGPNWYDCQTSFFNFYIKGRRDAKEQCVAVLTRNVEVLGSGPIKGHRCFLEQETWPLLLSTGWFQGWIHNRTKINWEPYIMEDWIKCHISPLIKYRQNQIFTLLYCTYKKDNSDVNIYYTDIQCSPLVINVMLTNFIAGTWSKFI